MERRSCHQSDIAKSTTHSKNNEVDTVEDNKDRVKIEPKVGLVGGISMIVGVIIGSGIFVSPKGVAEGSGSVGLSLVSWALCGFISLLGGLCYAELGTVIPESGGEYIYLLKAYGRFGKVLAFLFSWATNMLLRPAGAAASVQMCAEYIMAPLFDDGCGKPPELNIKLAGMTIILILVAINIYSTAMAAKVQIIFTIMKILALCIIIVGGIVAMAQGRTEHLASGFEGSTTSVGKFVVGMYQGMWAYDSWNNLNYITQDIKNPSRNLPLAICIAIPFVIFVYLLTNISYFTVMSVEELLASPAVAVTWANIMIPAVAWIMPLSVASSIFGGTNGGTFSSSRIMAATAKRGSFPGVFGMVHVDYETPVAALFLNLILVILYIFLGDFATLVNYVNFIVWMFYGFTVVALIIFRYTLPDQHRTLKVPIIAPVIVLCFCFVMVVIPMILEPKMEFLYAVLGLLVGFIFYVPFIHFGLKFPGMDQFVTFMQLSTGSTYSLSELELQKPVANINSEYTENDNKYQKFTTHL